MCLKNIDQEMIGEYVRTHHNAITKLLVSNSVSHGVASHIELKTQSATPISTTTTHFTLFMDHYTSP
jgi:hypothetical protein